MPRLLALLLPVPFSLLLIARSPAQARQTASKSADISVFGGFEAAHPDYGPYNSYGGIVGADFTRYLPLPIEPSLEFRANFHSSKAVSEQTYLAGLRVAVPLGRVKPYASFFAGPGDIHFLEAVGYTHDNSVVYSYGGGLDLRVTHSFAARFDLQAQHWNTGEYTYTPTLGTIGVVYTLPFRSHVGR